MFSFSTTWTGIRIVRALVGERARDRLADPPRRVGRELVALAPVELLGGAHEADRPLLDQVEERQTLVAVALRDRDDEAEVRLDHLLLRAMVAALDPLRELDLLGGGQQLDLADVLEEELERVGRDLADALVDPHLLLRLRLGGLHVDDLDLQLLERPVERRRSEPASRSSSSSASAISSALTRPGGLRRLEQVPCLLGLEMPSRRRRLLRSLLSPAISPPPRVRCRTVPCAAAAAP